METIWIGSKKRLLNKRIFLKRKNEQKQLVVIMPACRQGRGRGPWVVGGEKKKSRGDNEKRVRNGGQREKKIDLEVILTGQGAEAEVLAVMMGQDSDHWLLKLLVHHRGPQTKANVLIKTVVADQARVDFQGIIKIDKAAQLTTSYLTGQTLLLSEHARTSFLPQLEIEANDVKAGHAATMAKIDEQQLFYLMSRGLSRRQAEQMIVEGFLREVIDKIKSPN